MHGELSYIVSSDVKIARFFLVFTASAVYSRTNLILTRRIKALTWDALVDDWVHRVAWLYVENTNLMLTQYSMTNGVTFPS